MEMNARIAWNTNTIAILSSKILRTWSSAFLYVPAGASNVIRYMNLPFISSHEEHHAIFRIVDHFEQWFNLRDQAQNLPRKQALQSLKGNLQEASTQKNLNADGYWLHMSKESERRFPICWSTFVLKVSWCLPLCHFQHAFIIMPCRPCAFPAISTIITRLQLLWEDNTFVPQLSPNSQIATPTKCISNWILHLSNILALPK